MACEKCWADAHLRMWLQGGTQSDHYRGLLKERKDNPCTPEQQRGEEKVNHVSTRQLEKMEKYKPFKLLALQ